MTSAPGFAVGRDGQLPDFYVMAKVEEDITFREEVTSLNEFLASKPWSANEFYISLQNNNTDTLEKRHNIGGQIPHTMRQRRRRRQEMADAVSEVFLFRKAQKACWRCATNVGRGKAKRRATGKYIPAGEVGFEVSLVHLKCTRKRRNIKPVVLVRKKQSWCFQ